VPHPPVEADNSQRKGYCSNYVPDQAGGRDQGCPPTRIAGAATKTITQRGCLRITDNAVAPRAASVPARM
jgi:hypothetical protein